MKLYHGTNESSAENILGPPKNVDVTKGRGELGRGFYLGDNISLAASLSRAKGRNSSTILKFSIDDSQYSKLIIRTVKKREIVYDKWKNLIKFKETHTNLYNVDVVVAPFATIDFGIQYKFESINSQTLLNSSKIIKL